MKNFSLKNLNLSEKHVLQRNQLKTVFGGQEENSVTGRCTCKLSSTSSASTSTDDCDKCEALCNANYPNYTSWICSGA